MAVARAALAPVAVARVAVAQASSAGYRLWGHELTAAQLAIVALVGALALVVPRRAWRVGRLAVTAVHEGGHSVVAVLAGRRVTAVHLRPDASGVTYHRGARGWAGRVAVAAAGYPAPCLVGVVGAWACAAGRPRVWLGALAVAGIVNVLWWVRNAFGVLMMAVVVVGTGWLVLHGDRTTGALLAATAAWYLVLGGARAVGELFADRSTNDASDLGRLLHLPPLLCKLGFAAIALAAVLVGGRLLL